MRSLAIPASALAALLTLMTLAPPDASACSGHQNHEPAGDTSADQRKPARAPRGALALATDQFRDYTGARLVFERGDLPPSSGYDRMPTLGGDRRIDAAKLLLAEAKKYPRGYLKAIGMGTVGVFEALISDKGDGFRAYDDDWEGYVYFGRWNGRDAMVAAYYTDRQLPLTFHHEVYHQVDATVAGRTDHWRYFSRDDPRYGLAISGEAPYAALAIARRDRQQLKDNARFRPLQSAVSDYASKSPGEDQAETARWLMTHLNEGLYQAATQPELPGSQRVLHLLKQYAKASTAAEMDAGFLVDIALDRTPEQAPPPEQAATLRDNPYLAKVDAVVKAPAARSAIRAVQPAAVRLPGGSGVNIAAHGLVLTNAHVTDNLGKVLTVTFPDGQSFTGVTTAIDHRLDLSLVTLNRPAGAVALPIAPISTARPRVGDAVTIIGQPGSRTPSGKPTGYSPFYVSRGEVRGFLDNPLGRQSLGRTKHDAWTYWGHSGSPLLSDTGAIVALHNSWDSKTAMRHAVTWEAIVHFLRAEEADFTTR